MPVLSNILCATFIKNAHITRLSFLVGAALLTGCANMNTVAPGTPLTEVIKKYGKPDTLCKKEDGTERLIWSGQPYGQFSWGGTITKDGKVIKIEQVLTDEQFEVLRVGKWSAKQVECQFGPPANTDGIGKGNEIVWAYRYKQYDIWPSMMYVYMGSDGQHVTRFHPAPDPLTLSDSLFPM
jgi:hypothetical protein